MNLPNKTKPTSDQDMFNRIWNHFIVEKNPRCLSHEQRCMYRNSKGEGCAIGIVLPDELVNDLVSTISGILYSNYNVSVWLDRCSRKFLCALQIWHDVDKIDKKKLISLATRYKVKIPEHE